MSEEIKDSEIGFQEAVPGFEAVEGNKKQLKKMNVIIQKDNDVANIYSINKDYTAWRPLSKRITLSKRIMPVIQKDNASLSKRIPTIDNTTKEVFLRGNKSEKIVNTGIKLE